MINQGSRLPSRHRMDVAVRAALGALACASVGCSTPAPNEFSLISSYDFGDTHREIASYTFVARAADEATLEEPSELIVSGDGDNLLDGFFAFWVEADESDSASGPADSFTATWLEGPELNRIVWEWLPTAGQPTACIRMEILSDKTETIDAASATECVAAAFDDIGISDFVGLPSVAGQEVSVPLLFDPSLFEYVEKGSDDALPEQVDLGSFDVFESDSVRVEADESGAVRSLTTWIDGVLWTMKLRA